jgi:hypothetical protein
MPATGLPFSETDSARHIAVGYIRLLGTNESDYQQYHLASAPLDMPHTSG